MSWPNLTELQKKIETVGDSIQSLTPEEIVELNRYMEYFDFDWKIVPSRRNDEKPDPMLDATGRSLRG